MSFSQFNVKRVKQYADEVVMLCREVEADTKRVDAAMELYHKGAPNVSFESYNGVLRAELRRRSMDLTRALADLRKS